MESTIKFISERLEPSLLNKSFCDYFKNVRFENTTFSKNDGFYFNNVGTGEFSFTPLIGDCLNIFELENKVSGFKRISQSNRIYSVILKAISQSPKVIGDYIKKYEDVDGNSVILSEGGFENSFYYAFTSFFDKFVTKVSKDNDFLNKQDNYIEMMKVELGDFFVKVHELIVEINVVDFESFKYNDDLKTYYDRNDVILRYETLEAPKLVTKEELLKYLCLEE